MSYNKTTKKSSLQHNQYNNTGSINNIGKTKQPVREHKQSKVLEKKKSGRSQLRQKNTAPKSRQTDRKKNEKCVHLTAKRSNRAVTARNRAQCFDAADGPARHAVVDQNSAYRDVDAKCRRLLFGITCVVASVCMRVRACVNSCSSSTLPCSHLTTTGKNNNNNNS